MQRKIIWNACIDAIEAAEIEKMRIMVRPFPKEGEQDG